MPVSVLDKVAQGSDEGQAQHAKGERYSFLAVAQEIFLGKKLGSDEVLARDVLPHEWERPSRRQGLGQNRGQSRGEA